MAVLKMQKIELCAWKNRRKQVLEFLQKEGIVQIRETEEAGECFRKRNTDDLCACFARRAARTGEALKLLEQYRPEKKGLFASLEGKTVLTEEDYRRYAGEREKLYRTAEKILQDRETIEQSGIRALQAGTEREALKPWLELDVPFQIPDTRYTSFLTGTLPGQWTGEQLSRRLAAGLPGTDAFAAELLGTDAEQTCLALLCLRRDREHLEEALRRLGFARTSFRFAETPEEYSSKLAQKAEEEVRRGERAGREISELAVWRDRLRFLEDYYTMQAERYRVQGRLLQSRRTFFLSGFLPGERAEGLKEKLERDFGCAVELCAPEADEAVPVLLRNGSFAGPTESVVEAYGLPGRGEADPTSVMAIFYYFFFGLMLSDAGYGAVMVAGCLAALKKFPHMGEGIRKMLTMFLYCGISTTLWGILLGGYFGDVIPVVAETFFHREVTVPALWFAPLDDPMRLLLFSFLFGIIHLFTGLGIKGFLLLREKKYLDCFCQVGLWYLFLAGLILMLLPSGIFASMAGTAIVLPDWLNLLARVMAAAGALGILWMTGRRKKNFGLRLALGAYELYGVTSWLSDVLSYSRLLALGIATGVIASVINTMAAMAGDGILGAVVFAVIFLAGHALNLGINLLGAYVHTNRLQYVEFFGKFYEGSGEPFRPFSAEGNKYIKIR